MIKTFVIGLGLTTLTTVILLTLLNIYVPELSADDRAGGIFLFFGFGVFLSLMASDKNSTE